MQVPLSWLKELIETDTPLEQLSHTLTMTGLEVEGIEPTALSFEGVIFAQVRATTAHPDADSLQVATVFDGKEEFQVVCGAPNCRPGLTTAFAPVGSRLTNEKGDSFKIKKGKLRGVESFGMLCGADELGLDGETEGIMEFPHAPQPGKLLKEVYGDTVLHIGLTPNLSHCTSLLGVARELAAAEGSPLLPLPTPSIEESGEEIQTALRLSVESEHCPHYACRLIRNVTIRPSPAAIQRRLEACGIRSVNNVVDATNYVLLEIGHPLHGFDYDRLEGKAITVREAKEAEKLTTLDNVERSLPLGSLIIADGTQAVAAAGVMGGAFSEVGEQTQNVLLESAYFLPSAIRKASKQLNLSTEASKRFERGADPQNVLFALNRAAQLIQEWAGGEIAPGILQNSPAPKETLTVSCRLSRINAILGTQLSLSEVEKVFQRLSLSSSWDGKDLFQLSIPSYRVDLNEEIDLIEEVARIYGYGNIAKQPLQLQFSPSTHPHAPSYLFEQRVRQNLLGEGLQELMTCDLISPKLADLAHDVTSKEALISVQNPASSEQSVLRPSLIPGFLDVIQHNIARYTSDLSAFELGKIHMRVEGRVKEHTALGLVLTGKQRPWHWEEKPREVDFFDLKGHVENLCQSFSPDPLTFEKSAYPLFHPGRQAIIKMGELPLGILAEIHPATLRSLNISQRVFVAELSLHDLYQRQAPTTRMTPLPQYPGSTRDWTLTLQKGLSSQEVLQAISKVPSKLLQNVEVIDLYKGENVTLRLTYRSEKKTLSQEAVDREHARVQKMVQNALLSS